MRPSFLRTALVPALLVAAFATPARADEDAPEAHLQAGLTFRREHRNAEALAEFQRAFALAPTPRARAQIGFAEQALARWLEAEADLRAALASPNDEWVARNREPIEGALRTIDGELGWLTVACDGATARVIVDGTPRAEGCTARTRLVVGAHTLRVESKDAPAIEQRIDVGPKQELRVVPVAAPPTEAATAAPPHDAQAAASKATPSSQSTARGSTQRTAGYILFAVGAVGIVTSLALGAMALHERSVVNDHCTPGCDADGHAAKQVGSTLATWSTITFIAGVVPAAGGVTLVVTAPTPRSSTTGLALRFALP